MPKCLLCEQMVPLESQWDGHVGQMSHLNEEIYKDHFMWFTPAREEYKLVALREM